MVKERIAVSRRIDSEVLALWRTQSSLPALGLICFRCKTGSNMLHDGVLPTRLRRMLAGVALAFLFGSHGAAAEKTHHTAGPQLEEQISTPVIRDEPAQQLKGVRHQLEVLLTNMKAIGTAERSDREALRVFYAARNYEPLWFTATGYTDAAENARAELTRADEWGLDRSAFLTPALSDARELTDAQRAEAEIALSLAALRYARHARGGRTDPLSLSRNMDRQPPLLEPGKVIADAALTDAPGAYLRSLHPQHPQFDRLRQLYLATPISEADVTGSKATTGKKRKPSLELTREKLLFNMEQWRWMPEDLGQFYVWVNVPEFLMRVVKDAREIYAARVVVGRRTTPTPIFSDRMEHVIFHPFWNVPDSIKTNELLPSLAAGDYSVLSKQNLRVSFRGREIDPETVSWNQVDVRKYYFYQPPGSNNALGVVKFLFPNKHDVYLHDTPSKRLFQSQARAFSHGCIRVQNPLKLAEVLLAEDQGWTAERVMRAVQKGTKDNRVDLRSNVPVHITYFTVWMDDDGQVRTFSDIYDHEHRVTYELAGKSHLIRREQEPVLAQAQRPQRTAAAARKANEGEASYHTTSDDSSWRSGGDADWRRKVFRD